MFSNKLLLIFYPLLILGCVTTKKVPQIKHEEPHLLIFKQYGQDFNSFHEAVRDFKSLIFNYQDQSHDKQLKRQLSNARLAYKKVEFAFDYLEPKFAYLYVNGGPLPKLHEELAEVDLIPPNGLQRLDEIIFAEEIVDNLNEIKNLSSQLETKVSFIKESHLQDTITAQNSIELLRSGIVRVFTLGLTGFDTPGSGNAIEESHRAMISMRDAFHNFKDASQKTTSQKFQDILTIYNQGIASLDPAIDFEEFDRMEFLLKIVNPLYEKLFAFQKAMGIPSTSLNRHAQNYEIVNMFSENFLDRNYFSEYTYNNLNNPASIQLGKILFYDPILSKNLDLSCASCHNPEKAFADGLPKSQTNEFGVFTKRNSPTLIDAGYTSKYFWDLRERNLEMQVAHVIENSLEFNFTFEEIAKRLIKSKEYVNLFEEAYADIAKKDINKKSISNAIAAYVNTLTSFDSQFDKYVRGEIEDYSESARAGFNLFMGKAACGTCHFAPAFNGSVPPFYTDAESEVLGVTEGYFPDAPKLDQDPGRRANGRLTDAHDHFKHSFKTVTVRNAGLTAPYMHNGLFESLEDVIEFYDVGGGVGMGLDIENQTLAPDSLNLSQAEKDQLIDFLHTLSDTTHLLPGKITLPQFEDEPYWNQRGKPKVID